MNTGIGEALLLTAVMAAVILFCRAFPFIFFRGKGPNTVPGSTGGGAASAFLEFIERAVPPLAMTVLACNALAGPIYESIRAGAASQSIPVLAASVFTVIIHLWRRNPLLSIFGGTALYMLLR